MLVARLHGKGDLRLADEPVPEPGQGQPLVRVTAVGICGSDLHWWDEAGIGDAAVTDPLVLGHEAAGVIQDGPRRGERVALDPAIWCGTCRPCRDGYRNLCTRIRFAGHGSQDGAMREYLTWPAHLLHPLPDGLTDADGAMLEPLGVALHALDLGHVRLGARVAVVGCGPIGLLLIQALRAAGARSVTAFDPLAHRRAAALRAGAAQALDPAATGPADTSPAGTNPAGTNPAGTNPADTNPVDTNPADTGADTNPVGARTAGLGTAGLETDANLRDVIGDGVDVAFEIAGTDDAVRLAMRCARPGGRVVLGGIPASDETSFPASLARRKGLTIAMVRRMNDTYPRAIALADSGVVSLTPLVTDTFRLADAAGALASAAARGGLKVIVEPRG
ncbi:MAG TPA: alcohol dehydrogenase catalytic domain-containing protein [Streptosporangiaceae bacterium]